MSVNWAIGNHRTGALEFSYMILEYYRYSGRDISQWLPFVKSTLDFFDQHYRMRGLIHARQELDKDGRFIIFPASTCESHFFVSNPVPDVSGLQAIVASALDLPEEWQESWFGGKKELQQLQKRLPVLHLGEVDGDVVVPPAKSVAYPNYRKTELYINYPMFPFNQIGLRDKEMEYVHNTYKHWEVWQTKRAWEIVHSWANANVAFARMGMAENAADLTLKTLANGDFRFPAFWGPGYDWVPDHNWGGTGAVGLQEMLMQTLDDGIHLMPSWPEDWNVIFKLHAADNTVVEGSIKLGRLTLDNIAPSGRKKDIQVK